jgi:hypothetical protein
MTGIRQISSPPCARKARLWRCVIALCGTQFFNACQCAFASLAKEWLVATALDVHPAEIWPSRYFDSSGTLLDRKMRIRKRLNEEGKQSAI